MTIEEAKLLLAEPDKGKLVESLKTTSFIVPPWEKLKKQYNPLLHEIMTNKALYPVRKEGKSDVDTLKRIPLGLQKLTVNRVAQSMFAKPAQRQYEYDRDNETQKKAVAILEGLYEKVYIDSLNIKRAKSWNASCQVATVWWSYKKPCIIRGEESKFTLKATSYSEKEGYTLYPIADENGDVIIITIMYTNPETNKQKASTYFQKGVLSEASAAVVKFEQTASGWVAGIPEETVIFPVAYIHQEEPAWGGDSGTILVEAMEELLTYQGLYIRKNALPTFAVDYGEIDGSKSDTEETTNDARHIIELGKGGRIYEATWTNAPEATKLQWNTLRNGYFELIQVPDASFATLIGSRTSIENKEVIFSDSRAKADDLGGGWLKMFAEEFEILKAFASVMFPAYKEAFTQISATTYLQPYNVRTKAEIAEYITNAGQALSLSTKVRLVDEVDDVDAEVKRIQDEAGAESNLLGI